MKAYPRTSAYRFTSNTADSSYVKELKKEVKIENAQRRVKELVTGKKQPRLRVILKGRLGKHNVHAPKYRKGGEHWRYSCVTIRPEHASRFDVYVHEVLPEGYQWKPVDTSNLTVIDHRS